MGQQAELRPPDPGLDDDAIRAFTMGFLDGLRDGGPTDDADGSPHPSPSAGPPPKYEATMKGN